MKCLKLLTPGLLIAALSLAGCLRSSDSMSATADTKPASGDSEAAPHAHGTGPNGGVVFDLGSHHAEFTVDHSQQHCTILILGQDEKTPLPIAADGFVLNINETTTAEGKVVPPMTITMQPVNATDGKTDTFVGTDPGIGNVADFAGTVSGEIAGKPSMGEFKE
jgi:hypothetical protein